LKAKTDTFVQMFGFRDLAGTLSITLKSEVSFSGAAVDFGHGSTCGLCLIVDCLGKERGWFLVAHTIPSISI
jgi:hypothetical protein